MIAKIIWKQIFKHYNFLFFIFPHLAFADEKIISRIETIEAIENVREINPLNLRGENQLTFPDENLLIPRKWSHLNPREENQLMEKTLNLDNKERNQFSRFSENQQNFKINEMNKIQNNFNKPNNNFYDENDCESQACSINNRKLYNNNNMTVNKNFRSHSNSFYAGGRNWNDGNSDQNRYETYKFGSGKNEYRRGQNEEQCLYDTNNFNNLRNSMRAKNEYYKDADFYKDLQYQEETQFENKNSSYSKSLKKIQPEKSSQQSVIDILPIEEETKESLSNVITSYKRTFAPKSKKLYYSLLDSVTSDNDVILTVGSWIGNLAEYINSSNVMECSILKDKSATDYKIKMNCAQKYEIKFLLKFLNSKTKHSLEKAEKIYAFPEVSAQNIRASFNPLANLARKECSRPLNDGCGLFSKKDPYKINYIMKKMIKLVEKDEASFSYTKKINTIETIISVPNHNSNEGIVITIKDLS